MKKQKKDPIIFTETPQQSLEKILKIEILVAQAITEAKEKADQSIQAARDEINDIKEQILINARADRDSLLAAGIAESEKKAHQDLEIAKVKSEAFYKSGQKFIDSAVSNVIDVVLDFKEGLE